MLTTSITLTGKSSSDLEDAIHEVLRLIGKGFTSGFNSNEFSSFTFDIQGEEEVATDVEEEEA